MKLSASCLLLAWTLAPAIHAECDGGNDVCVKKGDPCTDNEDACCEDLGCFGFTFYKTCQEIPDCLPEWSECDNALECCGEEFVCALSENGAEKVCQKETIDTRTVPIPDIDPTDAPTSAPEKKNIKKFPVPDDPTFVRGSFTGDPHIRSFDNTIWDCHAVGEMVILKSKVTQRQVQARFFQAEERAWSSARGIVIQDEGDTSRLQFTMPVSDEGVSHPLGTEGCTIQFFVDGAQRDLNLGSGSDDVDVTLIGNDRIHILYKASQFEINLSAEYFQGCILEANFQFPKVEGDEIVGLLGTPDGDPSNDWIKEDGTIVPLPEDPLKKKQEPAYEFCTTNWCLSDPTDSLFTYNQLGLDFEDFAMCANLPYKALMFDHIENHITPEIEMMCQGEFECAMDAVLSTFEVARRAKVMRDAFRLESCSMMGGDCHSSPCCEGFVCAKEGGFAEAKCVPEDTPAPTCASSLAECNHDDTPCCEGLICSERQNGKAYCTTPSPECQAPGGTCVASDECCDGTTCVGPEGEKSCVDVAIVDDKIFLPDGEVCGYQNGYPCMEGSGCIKDAYSNFSKRCAKIPECWAQPWRPCGEDGNPECCEDSGMACQFYAPRGRKMCTPLPQCAAKWHSCDHVDCCGTDEGDADLVCKAHPTQDMKICYPQAALFSFDVEKDVKYPGNGISSAKETYEDPKMTLAAGAEKCAKKCLETANCGAFLVKDNDNGTITCQPKTKKDGIAETEFGFAISGVLKV